MRIRKPETSSEKEMFDDEVLVGVFRAEHQPTHAEKWERFASDPARSKFVREALARAEVLRNQDIDPGTAYLYGIADTHEAAYRQELIESIEIPDTPPETIS